jgi:hypothetical protein
MRISGEDNTSQESKGWESLSPTLVQGDDDAVVKPSSL